MLPKEAEKYFTTLLNQMLDDLSDNGSSREGLSNELGLLSDPVDKAIEEREADVRLKIRERETGLLKKVKEALARIETGTYGTCEECGEDIGLERLKARPVTLLCIKCKKTQEAREKLTGT